MARKRDFRTIVRSVCEYMASPNHIPRYKTSVLLANLLASLWIGLLICNIAVNKRCNLGVGGAPLGLLYGTLAAMVPLGLYLVFSFSCRYFLKIRYQSKRDANRAKLAMCTQGLVLAQKQRIMKTNFVIDGTVFVFELVTIALQFTVFNDCIPEDDCITPCSLMAWAPSLPFFLFSVIGIILKTSVVSSEFDYCLQSQLMEVHLHQMKLKGFFSKWFHLTERRQQFSAATCILFIGMQIIEGLVFCLATSRPGNYEPYYIAWGIQLYAMGAILLVSDGGVILLPWSFFNLLQTSTLRIHKFSFSNILVSPVTLMHLPRRKAVPMLFLASFPFAFVAGLSAYLGGHRYLIPNATFLAWICLSFLCQLFLEDMPASVDMLLLTTGEGNFGLVMSRLHFVEELRRVRSQHTGSGCTDEFLEISVPAFLGTQARAELCVVVSYRWSDEKLYEKKALPSSYRKPCVVRIKHTTCNGFDWSVCLVQSQLDALVEYLSQATEPYVWMDQFSIPQVSTSERVCLQHEERKREVRSVLVPKMTGLYSCASRVLALNNSWDAGLIEADWYQNRLWCVQEYCFPSVLDIVPKVDALSPNDCLLLQRRTEVSGRWFKEVNESHNAVSVLSAAVTSESPIGPPDLVLCSEYPQLPAIDSAPAPAPAPAHTGCFDIVLDWLEPSAESLEENIEERVRKIGSVKYLETVHSLGASDTNDTLSALAQPWFGIILTSDKTKERLIRHIVLDNLQYTPGPIVLINNIGVDLSRFSGSCSIDRMLSGCARGMEKGAPVQVVMNVNSSRASSIGHELSGQLIHPPGFNQLLAVLTYIPLDEFAATGQLHHLIQMTVSMLPEPDPVIISQETILMK